MSGFKNFALGNEIHYKQQQKGDKQRRIKKEPIYFFLEKPVVVIANNIKYNGRNTSNEQPKGGFLVFFLVGHQSHDKKNPLQ